MAAMSSSSALEYPSSGEFNVLVQRFKLLHLVQRVAHRDVSEMLDTVGLDGLSRKGVLSRWAWGDAVGDGDTDEATGPMFSATAARMPRRGGAGGERHRRGAVPQGHRVSPAALGRRAELPSAPPPRMRFARPTSRFDARVAAVAAAAGSSRLGGGGAMLSRPSTAGEQHDAGSDTWSATPVTQRHAVARRTQHGVRRTAAERDVLFARLAEPRHRLGAVVEEGEEGMLFTNDGGGGVSEGRYRRRGLAEGRGVSTTTTAPLPAPRHHLADTHQHHHYHHSHRGDLRAYYHAPSSDWVPGDAGETHRAGTHVDAAEDAYPASRYGGDAAAAATATAEAAAAGARRLSTLSLEGGPRVRSVNFAPLSDDAETAAGGGSGGDDSSGVLQPRRRTGSLVSLSFRVPTAHDDDGGGDATAASLVTGDDVPHLAATAPTVSLPRRSTVTEVGAPTVPQLHLPLPRLTGPGGGGGDEDAEDAGRGSASASGLLAGGTGRGSPRGGASNSRSASTSQFPKSPRVGRGLAPKAKPKGAIDSPRVPLEAVRHAAALVSRSGSVLPNPTSGGGGSAVNSFAAGSPPPPQQQQQQQPPPPARPSSARTPPVVSGFGGAGILRSPRPHTIPVLPSSSGAGLRSGSAADSAPRGATPSTASRGATSLVGALPLVDGASGDHVSTVTRHSFEELSSAIDHMLRDHQKLLGQVYKAADTPGSAATAAAAAESRRPHTARAEGADGSSEEEEEDGAERGGAAAAREVRHGVLGDSTIEVEIDSDGTDGSDAALHRMAEDVEDEMLLYTQLQHQITELDADMARLGLPISDGDTAPSEVDDVAHAAPMAVGQTTPPAQRSVVAQRRARRQRARGEVPDAVVQRLCAYRMDNFQHIAYNERLWNTSAVSQFAFAQRLTAALTEECWAEVMEEVGAIMDEYVDGLADHELQ
ncbi:hypothetical protein NESM_000495300 [Novymonas esmeraldas]|uniref:Uncharacterized protein n=1 Tax=Novymonas esmeraldas TaxID=1808958 RepID=A0AAW0ER18_9TRYP